MGKRNVPRDMMVWSATFYYIHGNMGKIRQKNTGISMYKNQ